MCSAERGAGKFREAKEKNGSAAFRHSRDRRNCLFFRAGWRITASSLECARELRPAAQTSSSFSIFVQRGGAFESNCSLAFSRSLLDRGAHRAAPLVS